MKKIIIAIGTAGVAGFIGYKIGYSKAKKYYEGLIDSEVDSVKKHLEEAYSKAKDIMKTEKTVGSDKEDLNKPLDTQHEGVGKVDYGRQYRSESQADRVVGQPVDKSLEDHVKPLKTEEIDTTKPYIISPEEFTESNHEAVTLWYFADKILTDDEHNIIHNIGIVGGHAILDQIGMYEADTLHVRDNKKAIDYEIVMEDRRFADMRPNGIVGESEED